MVQHIKCNEDILFSIIVPVFNTPKVLLDKCIDSVLGQTEKNFECIIVDDGSDEKCINNIAEISKIDSRIKALYLEHSGNSCARNYGVSIARGKYTTFVDSDDVISPYLLDEAAQIIQNHEPDMILGLVKAFSEKEIVFERKKLNEKNLIKCFGREEIGDIFEHIIGFRKEKLRFQEGYISGGPVARVIKTSIAKKSYFPEDELVTEDVLWNCEMMSNCSTAVIIPRVWYGYYHHVGTKSRKFYDDGVELFYRQIDYYTRYITMYWPERKRGLYKLLWQEVAMYFRIYLNNPDIPWKERYGLYKDIYKHAEYVEMVKNIDFSYEKNLIKRLSRELIVLMLRIKAFYPTWFVFKRIGEKAL